MEELNIEPDLNYDFSDDNIKKMKPGTLCNIVPAHSTEWKELRQRFVCSISFPDGRKVNTQLLCIKDNFMNTVWGHFVKDYMGVWRAASERNFILDVPVYIQDILDLLTKEG